MNTKLLCQHYEDINHDRNLQMFHILCFIDIKMHHASIDVHKFINSLKYSYISIHDGHGLVMMYDIHMHLDSSNIIISNGLEYIITTSNINTRKLTHIVCVYRVHSCLVSTFLNNLQIIIQHYLEHCPIINMGDFNVDILKDNNQAKNKQKLLDFMDNSN